MKESYKAAVCIGRQPKSDVWVFGEQLQLNSEGQIIDVEISSFVWVKDIFDKLEENGNKREKCALPLVNLPLSSLAVGYVVDALFQILHDNAMAGVFTIGMDHNFLQLISIRKLFSHMTLQHIFCSH